ncbi:MAG: hypothetical protein IRY99_14910, partial [Isosphaeraceae bacterium]|nr:hypothetical protein [Isosphaeraceae bacterium]
TASAGTGDEIPNYVITRRPVPSQGAREIALPTNVVIDLTTWNAPMAVTSSGAPAPSQPERSRLPVDPFTKYVDVMIAPNGQVLQMAANGNLAPPVNMPFYHFWLTEREDVYNPLWGDRPLSPQTPSILVPVANSSYPTPQYLLPMPRGAANPPSGNPTVLKAERRLVSLNTKTGQITTNDLPPEVFDYNDTSLPYRQAELGVKQEP